jgi:hypothetical protein
VQRSVSPSALDFTAMPDVSLLARDANAATLDLLALSETVAARGSATADADGQRQAMVVVRPGTVATAYLANGDEVSLPQATVRATEFTVGNLGPERMPGSLPALSGYTYAVDLSVDEAVALGAIHVGFEPPVFLFADNFLGFPAGTKVPTGYFDDVAGKWVATDDGIVGVVIAHSNGRAVLSFNAAGTAATAAELQTHAITDAELARIAEQYAPGMSFWRSPVAHFSPWDLNWPFGLPDSSAPPPRTQPKRGQPVAEPCEWYGSVIQCENQVLGEALGVVGTPYLLWYSSERASSHPARNSFSLPKR